MQGEEFQSGLIIEINQTYCTIAQWKMDGKFMLRGILKGMFNLV